MVDKKRLGEIDYEVGSGNVFADIGVPNPDEALVRKETPLVYSPDVSSGSKQTV